MSRITPALALLLLVAPACASGGRGAHSGHGDDGARAPVVVVPVFTVAPPPPPPPPPQAPTAPSLAPAANPACVLTANDIELPRSVPLHVEESAPFFRVDKAKALEVRLASPHSTVRASRSNLEIIGHVKLSDVPVRLRSGALVDGYLRVNHGALRDGNPAHLELEVAPPWFLTPVKAPVLPVGCDDVALARETPRGDVLLRGKRVDLRLGAPIAVRATPGGPVVATIWLPKPDPGDLEPSVDIYEIERRGELVRVRVEWDETDVEGWVSRRDVSPHAEENMVMGLLGSLDGDSATIALASEATLLVHTGGRVVGVGAARPGTFPCVKPANADAREIELDFHGPFGGLGLGGIGAGPGSGPQPAAVKLFVVPVRGEACVESTAKSR